MEIRTLKFSFTKSELNEVVTRYFGQLPEEFALCWIDDMLQDVKLDDIDDWCKRMVPYIPYLNEQVFNGRLDSINFLNWVFLVFYKGVWSGTCAMIREQYMHIDYIQKELGVPPNKHVWFDDEEWYQQLLQKTNEETDRSRRTSSEEEYYPKRQYDRDNFDALTDGQMGNYEDFNGTIDEVRDYMGFD